MRFIDATTYEPTRAWDALNIAEIDGATVRLSSCSTATTNGLWWRR